MRAAVGQDSSWRWAWSAPVAAVVLPSLGGLLGLIVVGIAERATDRWPGETAMYLAYSLRHLGLAAAFGWALLYLHEPWRPYSCRCNAGWKAGATQFMDPSRIGRLDVAAFHEVRKSGRAGMRQSTLDLLWIGGSMVLAIVVALLWPAVLDARRAYEDEWILVPVFTLPTVCVVASAVGLTLCGARSMWSGEHPVGSAEPSCQGTSRSSGMAPSAGSDGDHNSTAAQKSRGPVAATACGWSGVVLVVASLGLVAVGPLAGLGAGWWWLGAGESSEAMFVAVLVLGHSIPLGWTILLCLAAWWRATEVEVQPEPCSAARCHHSMYDAPSPRPSPIRWERVPPRPREAGEASFLHAQEPLLSRVGVEPRMRNHG